MSKFLMRLSENAHRQGAGLRAQGSGEINKLLFIHVPYALYIRLLPRDFVPQWPAGWTFSASLLEADFSTYYIIISRSTSEILLSQSLPGPE